MKVTCLADLTGAGHATRWMRPQYASPYGVGRGLVQCGTGEYSWWGGNHDGFLGIARFLERLLKNLAYASKLRINPIRLTSKTNINAQ